MPEEWFVRVLGREYGPVDLETLREWTVDGRLIATNEVRRASESDWVQAATALRDLFAPPPLPPPEPEPLERQRSLGGILAEARRIYAKGFWTFAGLAALFGIPLLGFKVSWAFTNFRPDAPLSDSGRIAAAVAILMGAAFIATWPLFVAGLQFATAELAAGRPVRLREVLRRAINFWPRIAQLCLITYSAFLFWVGMPLVVAVGAAVQPTAIGLLFAVLALAAGLFMFSRLFVNFLFWQQTATIGGLPALDALQLSKEVARSGRAASWFERPIARGVILLLLWFAVDVFVSLVVQTPFVIARALPAESLEQAVQMMQALLKAQDPDALTITALCLAEIIETLLRPLLGIAFVVLYFDAKTRER
jgi:hypothetical protein